jgi:protein-S-isoprenylcysteine O-methyltransferase Ste14
MSAGLLFKTLLTFAGTAALLGLLIFLPAGTLDYWQAWLFIMTFALSISAMGLYLSIYNPVLLERRKKVGPVSEERPAQRIFMVMAALANPLLLIVCGLDHRFGWSHIPGWLSVAGSIMVAVGLYIDVLVFQVNSFGGSNIVVLEDQHVITNGPYAIVRHPMYSGVLVMMLGIPLALGSWWGFTIVAIAIGGLILRILDEESLLAKQLPGYTEYMRNRHFRLVPYVW